MREWSGTKGLLVFILTGNSRFVVLVIVFLSFKELLPFYRGPGDFEVIVRSLLHCIYFLLIRVIFFSISRNRRISFLSTVPYTITVFVFPELRVTFP